MSPSITMIINVGEKPLFELGNVCASQGVADLVGNDLRLNADMAQCFARHAMGDWGEGYEEDHETNAMNLKRGGRLMSVYTLAGKPVWVFTEADRSVTTILLPDEY